MWGYFLSSCHLSPRRTDWRLPHHDLLSGSYRELEGSPWASFSADWAPTAPSSDLCFRPIPSSVALLWTHSSNVFLVMTGPKLHTGFEMWLNESLGVRMCVCAGTLCHQGMSLCLYTHTYICVYVWFLWIICNQGMINKRNCSSNLHNIRKYMRLILTLMCSELL